MESSGQTIKISSVKLPIASFLIGLVGVALSMWGASWDITSHLLRIPETFFTPSHMILYTGVGISVVSAILSIAVLTRKRNSVIKPFILGSKLVILGAILQIIAGPGDFYWHELFGIDGLLSPTHIALAIGILIVSIGTVIGFTRIQSHLDIKNNFMKFIIPIAFGVFWFAVMWMVFFFVLPISDGDTHNFNPDESFAVILSFVVLPFLFSIIFWSIARSQNMFGVASAATLAFVTNEYYLKYFYFSRSFELFTMVYSTNSKCHSCRLHIIRQDKFKGYKKSSKQDCRFNFRFDVFHVLFSNASNDIFRALSV